ncbi:MAG: Na+/H+ antiporter NhaC family protein, partial [Woeseiaceae bacterium]
MTDPSWYSILPPILAIILAIWSKQVILSLFAGIWIGYTLLNGFNPLIGVTAGFDGIINVFSDPGDTRVLIFTLVIGSLIATIEHSGGVRGFVHFLETRRWVHNPVRAQILAWATGLVIFIESNITLLVAGSVSRPLFDRYKISREKLAYLIDATSAPVCVMIPLNAWGAVIIGLVGSAGIENPLETFISSIPYNFYAIAAILLSGVVIWKNINLGPMKKAEERTQSGEVLWPNATPMVDVSAEQIEDPVGEVPSALLMVLPITAMILMMPVGLYITGDGNIIEGSGAVSILWSVIFALVVSWVMILSKGSSSVNELMRIFMKGAGGILPISTILLFALALGDVANSLGTGSYVAAAVGDSVPTPLLAPLVFIVSAFIAFSVGSSWGTFAIMIPIAIPIATTLGLSVPLLLGAAISGAIFGDHAS